MQTITPSIRCGACHDHEGCPVCLALNVERDAIFAPMSDKGAMDRAIDAAQRAWEMAIQTGLGRKNCWRSAITAAVHTLRIV